ncbi:MAG: L,D-transpeptidase family protein [Microthrixaceae bacterium]
MKTLDELLIEAGVALDDRCAEIVPVAGQQRSTQPRARWLAVSAAAALVGLSGVAIWATRDDGTGDATVAPTPPDPSAVSASTVLSNSTVPASSAAPPEPTPSTVVVLAPIERAVSPGSSGDDVRRVEQRLHDLGFFVGEIDGEFDDQTQRAFWAWRKLTEGLSWQDFAVDSSKSAVTPDNWLRMSESLVIAPRRPSGDTSTHVEVYLPQQVLIVFTADEPVLIAHISSGEVDSDGNPITFCDTTTIDTDAIGQPIDPPQEAAICAESKTPGGVFKITRRHDGKRFGPLGGMYRPQYFNYGIAIHGAENVPDHPVSHGAIRVTNAAADALWDTLDTGDDVYVWGQDGREPETYTKDESLPSFNRPDPSATTTT